MKVYGILGAIVIAISPAYADQVTVQGGSVYVTKDDCVALVAHHPRADTNYQPGRDVHGNYVAPADLADAGGLVPGKVGFNVRVNPLSYSQGQAAAASGQFANTAMPIAHVDVDLETGETLLNGKSLTPDQDHMVLEACRKAGYR